MRASYCWDSRHYVFKCGPKVFNLAAVVTLHIMCQAEAEDKVQKHWLCNKLTRG